MRSKLFVPGSRPELFDKAFASGADGISFDLEDAVAANRKEAARAAVAEALGRFAGRGGPLVIVRVNPRDSALFDADLDAVVRRGLDMLNLPKIEGADEVRDVADRLGRLERERGLERPIGILANIETPRGVRLAAEIACADPRVIGLQVGFGDLFEPFGISRQEPVALNGIRLAMRLAAAEAGIAAYDGAFVNVAEQDGFRAEAETARRFGFAGKSCIHPSQIAMANAVFSPTPTEVAWARKVVDAASEKLAAGVGAFMLDGVMVDEPFIVKSRAVLALVGEAGDA